MPWYRITGYVTRTCFVDVQLEAADPEEAIEAAKDIAWEDRTESAFDTIETDLDTPSEVTITE